MIFLKGVSAALAGVALALAGCGGGGQPRAATPIGAAPRFTLQVGVRPSGGHVWHARISARPGNTIEHVIELANVGGEQATGVRVRVALRGGERPVLASEYIKPMGVEVANADPLPPGLFGRGVQVGPLPGGGSVEVITFETRVGRRSFDEPAKVSWNGGQVSRRVRVNVGR